MLITHLVHRVQPGYSSVRLKETADSGDKVCAQLFGDGSCERVYCQQTDLRAVLPVYGQFYSKTLNMGSSTSGYHGDPTRLNRTSWL